MRRQRVVAVLSLIALMSMFAVAAAQTTRAAQQAGPAQPFSDWAVNELSRRVTILEGQSLDGRVRVLESDVAELKWMSRGVALAVAGQLVAIVIGLKRKGQ